MNRTKIKSLLFIVSIAALSTISSFAVNLKSVEIPSDDTVSFRNVDVEQVVVTGSRSQVDRRLLPMSVTVLGEKQIDSRYEQSVLPLLTEQVPGLFISSRGMMGYGVSTGAAGGVKMRGIGSGNTGVLILIDGHPQFMGLMGHSVADVYQSMIAERVEVVRGPASVLYGSNAMGGVINILTKSVAEDGFSGNGRLSYGSYNTATSDVNLNFRSKGFYANVSGSYNRTEGHRANMGFEQFGGYAKVGYEFSANWEFFADVNVTHFNAQNPGTVARPIFDNVQHITRGMTSLSLENNYEKTSGALKLFYNWGNHNINDGYYEGGTPRDYLFNSFDNMFGVTLYQSVSFFKGNRVTFGFDYQRFGGRAWNDFLSGTQTELVDKTEDDLAGYVDFRQTIGRFVTLNAGIRFDHHSRSGSQWVPQFGASLYPIANGEIKLLASRGFRNPTIREMYMFPPQNPNLKPESLWNYELSWSQRLLSGRLSYGVNLFYINGENMIETLPVDGRPMNVNTGAVENMGAELSFGYRISREFNLSANYSYLKMVNLIVGAPEHKLFLGLDFTKNRWRASTGVQYIAGLYTSVAADVQVKENFVLWSLRGGFRATKWLEIFVRGENLLNQKYEINAGFPMPGANAMAGLNFVF